MIAYRKQSNINLQLCMHSMSPVASNFVIIILVESKLLLIELLHFQKGLHKVVYFSLLTRRCIKNMFNIFCRLAERSDFMTNTSKLLDSLLSAENYDKQIRPDFGVN